MLKSLNKNDTQIIPFVVTKNWDISNVTNESVILMEHAGEPGLPVAFEYTQYSPITFPIVASACDIALEQQDADIAGFRLGQKIPGTFYPNLQPENLDGTYKTVVYSQIATTFYNDYRDPTKIWGLENIDFELSQTKRFIADEFKLFTIPQISFGEKIVPYSIQIFDDTTDNDYVITDDGNCNLFAGPNIFSHQQELGEYKNTFIADLTASYCDFYWINGFCSEWFELSSSRWSQLTASRWSQCISTNVPPPANWDTIPTNWDVVLSNWDTT